jgi:hypothetical protein
VATLILLEQNQRRAPHPLLGARHGRGHQQGVGTRRATTDDHAEQHERKPDCRNEDDKHLEP